MSINNIIDVVVTEDSDLLVFGAKKVLLKYDKKRDLHGDEIVLDEVLNSEFFKENSINFDKFIQICILTGCDYLKSPRGIGIQRSFKFFLKYGNIEDIMTKGKYKFPKGYLLMFKKSYLIFKHMVVYD